MFYHSTMQRGRGILPGQELRGRGAVSNAAGRFEGSTREAVDDGWDLPEEARVVRTEVRHERARSALSWNSSPDLGFDRAVNPYRGCEHGCVYCYARPTHAYLNLSPGLDFETRLIARPGIGQVLARELSARGYAPAVLVLGSNTDPYQPIEARERVTREVLEVCRDFLHPVGVTTRGSLVERDIDILAPMAAQGLARVGVSLTTLDPALARRMEPRAPAPARRLAMIRRLSGAGVPVRVLVSPLVPALTDHELEPILAAAAEAGAVAASTIPLRLPREVAGLFRDWIEAEFPDRAARIMGRVRELHGGRDYDPDFGVRMKGQGIWADLMRQRFRVATERLGLAVRMPPMRTDLFRIPPRPGDQLSLF
ncbi:MAG: PA0069 family radical SAM protein [Paracoccaceae bacterium]|nr:MAG: PA0069 family radical SAM protein [Paracoccaceae bacterium]